jgi:hypothetical protein
MNTVQILDRLVGFPTVSHDSNLALIEYVREFLATRGVESKLYLDAGGRKAHLYARIGPADRGGVPLSGHTDVQPRRLLQFCGLEWQEASAQFHHNPLPTTTASAAQVRRPIYDSSVSQWRHYQRQLAPLQRQLGAAGIDVA